ncbi:hypothetical protein [Streptomyces sp. NPDC001985]|uniref:hypothetical protein n=1 Tax=Streptomyces sp. NPDC001985 TaxID=3154406 RepID=UPI00331E4369
MERTCARPGNRFDPARCDGSCPVCGAIVGSPTGSPTTIHQGSDGSTCSGTNQPAT